MKVAPVSADLLIKLALVAVAVGAVWYVGRQVTTSISNAGNVVSDFASDAASAAAGAVNAVNPWNNDNVINQTANRAVEWWTGVPGDTLGDIAYELVNRDSSDSRFYRPPPPPLNVVGNFEISPYAIAP